MRIPSHSGLSFHSTRYRGSDQAGNGVRWSLEAGEDLNINLVHLEPGSGVDTHTNHEVDVVVIVLDGNGRLSIDTTDHELAPHVL